MLAGIRTLSKFKPAWALTRSLSSSTPTPPTSNTTTTTPPSTPTNEDGLKLLYQCDGSRNIISVALATGINFLVNIDSNMIILY